MAENTSIERVVFEISATEDGELQVTVDGVKRKIGEIGTGGAAALNSVGNTAQGVTNSINSLSSPLDRFGRQLKNVFAVSIAFEFIRAVSFIEQSFASLVTQGISYNRELQTSQIALAAVHTALLNLGEANGQNIDKIRLYPIYLANAVQEQKDLLIASFSTLGTAKELTDVYQRILGFTTTQKGNDQERLVLAENILNAGKLLGLTQDQVTTEARQILTLETNRGQTILQSLGYTAQQLRSFQQQGTLIQELNRILAIYSGIAKDVGKSFEGTLESVKALISFTSASAFSSTFSGLKAILDGIKESLTSALNRGDLTAVLGVSNVELQKFGNLLGDIIANTEKGLAKIINDVLAFGAANTNTIQGVIDIWNIFLGVVEKITSAISLLIGVFGVVAGAVKSAFSSEASQRLIETQLQIDKARERLISFASTARSIQSQGDLIKFANESKAAFEDYIRTISLLQQEIETLNVTKEVWSSLGDTFKSVGESLLAGLVILKLVPGQIGLVAGATTAIIGIFGAFALELEKLSTLRSRFVSPDFNIMADSLVVLRERMQDIIKSSDQAKDKIEALLKVQKSFSDLQQDMKSRPEELGGMSAEEWKNLAPAIQAISVLFSALLQTLGVLRSVEDTHAQQIIRNEAKYREELAKSVLATQQLVGKETGDVKEFWIAAYAEIEAQRQKDLAGENLSAIAKGLINAKAAEDQKRVAFSAYQFEVSVREQNFGQLRNLYANIQSVTDAFYSTTATGIQTQIKDVQLQLDLAKEFNGTLQEKIDLTLKLIELEKQEVTNSIAGKNEQIRQEEIRITQIQKEIDFFNSQISGAQGPVSAAIIADAQRRLEALGAELLTHHATILKDQADIQALGADYVRLGEQGVIAIRNLQNEEAKLALVSTSSLRESIANVITGIEQGTQSAAKALGDIISGIGVKFWQQLIVGKDEHFDRPLIGNISDLFLGGKGGIIGELFGQGGAAAFASFTSGWDAGLSGVGANVLRGQAPAIQVGPWQQAGNQAGSSFLTGLKGAASGFKDFLEGIFGKGNLGPDIGAGIAGNFAGNIFSSLFKLNKSDEAKIGAQVGSTVGGILGAIVGNILLPGIGGPIGAFIGSFLGDILGGVIGGLFSHIPSKGRQVREGVVSWLKDIDSAFKDVIDSGEYGFDWIKENYGNKTAEAFLEGSRAYFSTHFADAVTAGLDKQLLAIGVAVTAKQAEALGKSVDQTAQTFAGMIANNLKGDVLAISGFIHDTIDKAKITFIGLISAISDAMNENQIDATTWKNALEGAVSIFFTDFPKAIDIMHIVNQNMKEGKLDVEAFAASIEGFSNLFRATGTFAATEFETGFTSGLTGGEVAKDTSDAIDKMIRQAITQAAISNTIGTAFTTAFVDALGPVQALITQLAKGEITLDKFKEDFPAAFALARPQIEAVAKAFGVTYDVIEEVLRAAGLLPDSIDDSKKSADALVSTIEKLTQDLIELSRLKIEIKIKYIQDLASIGVLTQTQSIDAQIVARRGEYNALLQTKSPIATKEPLTSDELARAIELNGQLADLEVQRYNAEVDRFKSEYNVRLDEIAKEKDARDKAIRAYYQGIQDAANAEIAQLNKVKDERKKIGDAEIQRIKDLASLAGKFNDAAKDIQSTIDQLVKSTFEPVQSAAYFTRQRQSLEAQLGAAAPEDRPQLMKDLANAIQNELDQSPFAKTSINFLSERDALIKELEDLRQQALASGANQKSLDQQAVDLQTQMEADLSKIDDQIDAQRKIAEQASRDMQAALEASDVQAHADAEAARVHMEEQISTLRETTAQHLLDLFNEAETLAARRDKLLTEQRNTAIDSLSELIGIDKATARTQSDSMLLLTTLAYVGAGIHDLNDWLATNVPAASGAHTSLRHNRLYLAHAGEDVHIDTPDRMKQYMNKYTSGSGSGGGTSHTLNLDVRVPLQYLGTGNSEEDANEIVAAVMEKITKQVDTWWEMGWNGRSGHSARKEIRKIK